MQKTVFLIFALSIIVLAVLHTLSLVFSLYWVYEWLDIPMHALGGAMVALGYQSRFGLTRYSDRLSFGFLGTIGAVMFVGVSWEVYEYIVGPILPGYVIDTATDLVMDAVGACIGYVVAKAVAQL